MDLLPSLPASLGLGGLPSFAFILCDIGPPVCRTALPASAGPLPFPLPLSGVSVERCREGANPEAGGKPRITLRSESDGGQ